MVLCVCRPPRDNIHLESKNGIIVIDYYHEKRIIVSTYGDVQYMQMLQSVILQHAAVPHLQSIRKLMYFVS